MPLDAVTILPEDPNKMVVVVIFNRQMKTLVHLKYADRWTLCVGIASGKHKITIVNVYCRFSMQGEIFVQKIYY